MPGIAHFIIDRDIDHMTGNLKLLVPCATTDVDTLPRPAQLIQPRPGQMTFSMADGQMLSRDDIALWMEQQRSWQAMLDETRDDYLDCYKAMPGEITDADRALEAEYYATLEHRSIAILPVAFSPSTSAS